MRRTNPFLLLLAVGLVLVSCTSEPMLDYEKYESVAAPSGVLVAQAFSYRQAPSDRVTKVFATYVTEGCIREIAVVSGADVRVRLEWLSDSQLQVAYPEGSVVTEPKPEDIHSCFTVAVFPFFVAF